MSIESMFPKLRIFRHILSKISDGFLRWVLLISYSSGRNRFQETKTLFVTLIHTKSVYSKADSHVISIVSYCYFRYCVLILIDDNIGHLVFFFVIACRS